MGAKKAHEASKKSHTTCLEELAKDKEQPVKYGDIAFSALNQGSCKADFFTSNANYNKALKSVNDKTAACGKIDGETTGLGKAVDDAVYSACLARGKCETDAESAKDKTYDESHKACGSQKNKDAFTRAHHMKCVLAGKTLQGCTVPTAPSVKKTAMNVNSCELKCKLMNNYEHSTCSDGGVKGFRIDIHCGKGIIGLLINNDDVWDPDKTYHCPKGWYWPKAQKYFSILHGNGCNSNNQKSSQGKHAMYSRCGFNGYHPPTKGGTWGPQRYFFRFADSKSNNVYQHAGNYMGLKSTSSTKSKFAGIGCVKNGH